MTKCRFERNGANRSVRIRGDLIEYEYKTGNLTAYCTCGPQYHSSLLFAILNDKGLSPSLSEHVKDRIQLRKRSGADEIKGRCYLHELVYACYHGWINTVETWPKDLAKFRKWARRCKFEIDHADGNQLNNTVYNLSLMKHRLNSAKTIVNNIRQPILVISGKYGKAYRIAAFMPGLPRADRWMKLRCKTAADYVSCLKQIQRINGGYGKPLHISDEDYRKARPVVTQSDLLFSINGQELLARIDERAFRWCTGKRVRQICGIKT